MNYTKEFSYKTLSIQKLYFPYSGRGRKKVLFLVDMSTKRGGGGGKGLSTKEKGTF